jgi:hypothetical protein
VRSQNQFCPTDRDKLRAWSNEFHPYKGVNRAERYLDDHARPQSRVRFDRMDLRLNVNQPANERCGLRVRCSDH